MSEKRSRRWEKTTEGKEYTKQYYLGWSRKRGLEIKITVLSHYGYGGILRCNWPGCCVDDIDMLSLDHINNDGCKDIRRDRRVCGVALYRLLISQAFPSGFQTLCYNHQMKKEFLRRRLEN